MTTKTKPQKQFVALKLTWTESERGWGQRPDGYSLHETQQDVSAYIAAYWAEEKAYNLKHGITGTPECYSRPDGEYAPLTAITKAGAKALREATEAGKHGIRQFHGAEFLAETD